ncbi:uncharacterized protein LOC106642330 [Copidosoma floridanum]|uniref:uncharacterized protein LOC106642330 n=1 Tax=Copidosoma floridanum TaxID=29053 RepID=UPI0006C9B1E3|nr:uncharacterized protein LOC106642330 [Copidosoma floridanum]
MQGRSVIARCSLLLLALPTLNGDQWLMQGDFIPESEARRSSLVLATTNSTTSVSSSMRLTLTSPPRHRINCVLAAALGMNGNVRLVDGGVGFGNVTLGYETISGKMDQLFVQIESNAEDRLSVRDNVAENSRVTILYDMFRDWQRQGPGTRGDVGDGYNNTVLASEDESNAADRGV